MIERDRLFEDNIKDSDYGVTVVEYCPGSAAEVDELTANGWKCNIYDGSYRALAPRLSLCDLVDLRKVFRYDNDVVLNIAYTNFLNGLLAEGNLEDYVESVVATNDDYTNFAYHISRGESLGSEVKISGSDLRVHALRSDLIRGFMASPNYSDLRGYYRDLGVSNCTLAQREVGAKTCSLFDSLESHAQTLSRSIKVPRGGYAVDTTALEGADSDVLLFAPYGCFSLLHHFVDDGNCDQVMFREMHFDRKRGSGAQYELFMRDLGDKNVLIIDSVYSGNTVAHMRDYVAGERGNPVVVGVSPKSLGALATLDYAMVLDKVHNVSDLGQVGDDFFEQSYIETFNVHRVQA